MRSPQSIVLYGGASSLVLTHLWQYLLKHSQKRILFVQAEAFLRGVGIRMWLDEQKLEGAFLLSENEVLDFSEIISLCVEFPYISPQGLEQLTEKDRQYVQNEGWATLTALMAGLQDRCLVVNPPPPTDLGWGRAASVLLMQRYGFSAPHTLVTSHPDKVRDFFFEHNGFVVYKHVRDPDHLFKQMTEMDLERIEKVALCPIYFEEVCAGKVVRLVVIGPHLFSFEEAIIQNQGFRLVPAMLEDRWVGRCRALATDLGQVMCEFILRITQNEECQALGIMPFPTLPALTYVNEQGALPVSQAVLEVLEQGLVGS